jgi:hypothetical protein
MIAGFDDGTTGIRRRWIAALREVGSHQEAG